LKKILIIRFSSIGDIVLTTPIIRCLKQQTSAKIYYLTKKNFTEILENNPYIDELITFEKEYTEVAEYLKELDFDLIIDLHHNLRSMLVKSFLNKPAFSFNKLNIHKWLIVKLGINFLPKKHIVDRYFDTLKEIGIVNDFEGLDFFIDKKNEVETNKLINDNNEFIAFVIGAKFNTKQLTSEKIISICNKINYPVLLLGGNEDFEKGESIVKNTNSNIINVCGKYNLIQSASIIKNAKLVITHDTGLMHIASSFNKNIISIWGNTIPEFGMYPYLPKKENFKIVEVKNLKCRPCSKIGFNQCPKKHFNCIDNISPSEVIALSEQL